MLTLKRTLLIACLAVAWAGVPPARAAQDAVVSGETAAVREQPTDDAKIIETLPLGEMVRVSSKPTGDWFKVRTKAGHLGWVAQKALTLLDDKGDFGDSRLRQENTPTHDRHDSGRKDAFLFVSGGALGNTIYMQNFNQTVGLDTASASLAMGYYFDLSVVVIEKLRVGVRYMSYSSSNTVAYDGNTYKITNSGNPVLFGLEREIADLGRFSFDLAGYGGYSPNTKAGVSATSITSASANATAFGSSQSSVAAGEMAFLLNITAYWHAYDWLSVMAGIGYNYCKIPSTTLPGFQGQVPAPGNPPVANSSAALTSIDSQQIGPLVTLGLQLRL